MPPLAPLSESGFAPQPAGSRRRAAAGLARLALCLLASACGGDGKAPGAAAGPAAAPGGERATPVVVAALHQEDFADRIEALGTGLANESVVITAQVIEKVQRVVFHDGQEVAEGDVLVELTSAQQSAQLAEARANHDEALRQYRRTEELVRNGSESQARLDQQATTRDAAAARLRQLEAMLSDHLIRAPFAGVLGLRQVSLGTLVRPGDTITTLDDISVVKVDFSVPEAFLSALRPGLELAATSAAWPGEKFAGMLSAVDTRVDPRTRAVRARAELPNPDKRLRPGMLLAIELLANPQRAIALPEQALVSLGEHQYVFIVGPEQRAKRVEVRLGRRRPGAVEVVSGLSGDETLIVDGADLVQDGGLVRAVSPTAAGGTAPAAPATAAPGA